MIKFQSRIWYGCGHVGFLLKRQEAISVSRAVLCFSQDSVSYLWVNDIDDVVDCGDCPVLATTRAV